MYEFFDHTADVGLRVRAADLNTLFEEAARGLFALVVETPPQGEELKRVFRLSGARRDHLLFDWLNELLYVFDTERLWFGRFSVKLGAEDLQATAWGRPVDPQRHRLLHEIKAITYHGLKVEGDNDGWMAEVIVDI